MAESRTFTLVGQFKDGITPALKKINANIAKFQKSFAKSFSKSSETITKDWAKTEKSILKSVGELDKKLSKSFVKSSQAIGRNWDQLDSKISKSTKNLEKEFAQSTRRIAQNSKRDFKAIGQSFEEAVFSETAINKSLKRFDKYHQEIQRRAKQKIQGGEIIYDAVIPETERGRRGGLPSGGPGAPRPRQLNRPFFDDALDDGFTIEKGVIAGIAVEGVTRIMDMLVNSVGGAINYLKGAVQERVEDEMSDIKSAGGIFSIGKDKKVAWADTFDEGMALQKNLNAEMANLAAALPGTTNDYVRNMKQVTDTAMKAVTTDTQAMIKELNSMKDLGIAEVKTQQEAFVQTTKQLAKFSTLAEQGASGGTPFTMLMEQIIGAENVNIEGMKRRYVQLRDPLLSGALKDFETEMNAAKAGSPKRIAAMFKALNKAFPPEVIAAMEKSADGIFQAMKSYLFDPDIGWFGLGRLIKMDFSGFKGSKMGKLEETMSVFEMFVKMFGAFGQVLGPIIAELPKLMEVFDPLINPMKEFYVNAENTISNLNAAKKEFAGLKVSFPMFRASLKAIGQLAKSFGANQTEVDKLNKMLYDPNINIGAALEQAMKTLFSSEAMERFGKAVGEALGGFLSMLAGLAEKGKGLVDQSGLVKGFAEGWKKSGGSEAIAKIIRDIIGFIVKAIIGLTAEAIRTDPIGMALIATIFVAPIRNAVINFLKQAAGMASSNIETAGNQMGRGRGGSNRALDLFRNRRMEARRRLAMRNVRGAASFGGELIGLGYETAGRPGSKIFGGAMRGARSIGRAVPGAALAGGAIDMGLALASGENFGKAAAGAIGTTLGGVVGSAFGPVGTMIGMTAGGMIGDAAAGAIEKIVAKGPGVEQMYAAQLQNDAALKQLQAAKLQRGGLEPDKATYTFGTFQQFSDRLKVLGLDADKAGIALRNLYGKREAAAAEADKAAKELNTKIAQLKAQNIPPDLIAKQVAPLQKQFNVASKNLAAAQAEFDAQFRKTPGVIQQSITRSLSTLSFKNIETILGDKIAQIKVPQFAIAPGALTVKAPEQPGAPVKIPNWKNANWQQKPKAPGLNPIFQNTKAQWEGGLGDAIASEMKNKPSGSDLVIANSSETVIPAAGGYGMKEFMDVLGAGFSAVNNQYKSLASGVNNLKADTDQKFGEAESRNSSRHQDQSAKLSQLQTFTERNFTQINQNIATLSEKVNQMGSMGGMFGGAGGGMDLGGGYGGAGVKIAGALGNYIKSTGGAPGSIHEHPQHGGVKGRHAPGSYHYSGRAIDIGAYANEQAGVIARIKAFNAKHGVKPVEFLHAGNDPKGHSDHVHVAYNKGNMGPLLEEMRNMPAGAKVAAVNDSEFVANKDQTRMLATALRGYSEVKKLLMPVIRSNAFGITTPENTEKAENPMLTSMMRGYNEFKNLLMSVVGNKVNTIDNTESAQGRDQTQMFAAALREQQQINNVLMPTGGPAFMAPPRQPTQGMMAHDVRSGNIHVNAPITINQQPSQDPEELATMVAMRIGEAVAEARASSIFV